MITQQLHAQITKSIKLLQRYADRRWYAPLISFLAALDNLIVIIPNDGILISSTMLIPKRWLTFAIWITVGSTVGAMLLASLVELHGLPWILNYYPWLSENSTWGWMNSFFVQYGLIVVFIVAATPLAQQPAVILAALANTPLTKLAMVIFAGRLIKFLLMAYIASHAPKYLAKMWGVKGELKDVGVTIEKS